MSRHQTFRVLVADADIYSIDLPASCEAAAISRAEGIWCSGRRNRFEHVERQERATFAIDCEAVLHLRDIANEDRARWAKNALQAFSRETGSDMGPEALHDLLCDLGHYARSVGLDFRDEFERAASVCAAEVEEEAQS